MTWTLAIALVLLILLVFEWWSRSRPLRFLTIVVALVVFWDSTPVPYRALRGAMDRKPVTQNLWNPERKATEFESGVFTMYQSILDDFEFGAWRRAISFATLTLLALTPVLWRRRDLQSTARPSSQPGAEPSGLTSA